MIFYHTFHQEIWIQFESAVTGEWHCRKAELTRVLSWVWEKSTEFDTFKRQSNERVDKYLVAIATEAVERGQIFVYKPEL